MAKEKLHIYGKKIKIKIKKEIIGLQTPPELHVGGKLQDQTN